MQRSRDIFHAESPDALRQIYKITRKWREHEQDIKHTTLAPKNLLLGGTFPITNCGVSKKLLCSKHTKILKYYCKF